VKDSHKGGLWPSAYNPASKATRISCVVNAPQKHSLWVIVSL